MLIRILLVVSYIFACFRLRLWPWQYFQLNAKYFNETKGFYSKLDIDQLIPVPWRLSQVLDRGQKPVSYPVFIKPEWGQNAKGVRLAYNEEQLNQARSLRGANHISYLLQQAAPGKREFEIFVISDTTMGDRPLLLSVTEVLNKGSVPNPVNGIYNKHTYYRDITDHLNQRQTSQLWCLLGKIGDFRIARYGLRANSVADILNGHFHIFEINLFVPMPLFLLSENVSLVSKVRFVFYAMNNLAQVTKTIPVDQKVKSIFFRYWRICRRLKLDAEKEIA